MSEKLRILHIITTGSTNNGILSYVLTSMEAIGNAVSFDVVVLKRPEEWIASPFEALGAEIFVLSDRNRNPLNYTSKLKSIIQAGKYDIVHAHGNSCTLYTEMHAAESAGAQVRIAHAHNTSCRMKTLHRVLRNPFDSSYTHAAACGSAAGRFLFEEKPFTVLKNGIDCNSFAFDADIREKTRKAENFEGRTVLLHVGNFNAAKNQDFLLGPFQKAYEKNPKLLLVFVGSGECFEEVKKEAEARKLDETAVRFLGRRNNVSGLLCAADAFVLPSLYEGFPISLLEAQASGLCCLVSDTVTSDSNVNGDVEFLPLEEEPWEMAFLHLPESDNRENAYIRMKERGFDRKDAALKLLEYYNNAAKGRSNLRKLYIVTRNMAGGGCERVISKIANVIAKDGVECKILTQYRHESFYPLDRRIRLESLLDKDSSSGRDVLKTFLRLRKIVKKEKPDIVLAMPDMVNVWSAIFLKGTGVPLVVSERNDPARFPESEWKRRIRRPAYKNVKGFIFQTEEQKTYFPEDIQKRSIVLDNPLDCSSFPEREEINIEKSVVSVGRLSGQKNQELLLKAFGTFHKTYPDWKLIIYGEGNKREELEKLAGEIGPGIILLPGEVQNVPEKIKNAGMFVLCSQYEGMPNALIEAMALGIPCISTDCPAGGPKSLIHDGINGMLVPVGDEKTLTDAMGKIASDAGFAKAIGKEAGKIRERMDAVKVAAKWKSFLEENIIQE